MRQKSKIDASSHLYKRVCPSVGRSVRPSVRPSVRLAFFLNRRNRQIWKIWQILTWKSDKIWQIFLQFNLSPLLWTHLCSNELVSLFLPFFFSHFFSFPLSFFLRVLQSVRHSSLFFAFELIGSFYIISDVDILIEDAFKTAGSLSTVGIETQRRKHLAFLMADHGTLINPESSQNLPKHKLHRRWVFP